MTRRYLIRSGCADDWMVWDRSKLGPATLRGQKLVRLSRDAAEAAFARLVEVDLRHSQPLGLRSETWQIKFRGTVVDCRDELDAKSVARELLKKGFHVTAQSTDRDGRMYLIEPAEIWTWLSE
ncbi:MAG TPA: hypothetical protein VH985_15485 [Candidatus Binatia bacterium]|jgi:hypothetical protein